MDNQVTEPIETEVSDLDRFVNVLNPKEETTEAEGDPDAEVTQVEVEDQQEDPKEEQKITVEVDGKQVELTAEQIAEAYKNGLRQDDYTRKTQQVSEERKAIEAERQKAVQERTEYAQKLSGYSAQLQYALNEQSNIDWNALIEQDPVEFLKQKHLYEQRQAEFQKINDELSKVEQISKQEQEEQLGNYLREQSEKLLEKIPAWKDAEKAKAERAEIKSFLKSDGFTDDEIAQVYDHRHVLLIRDAMQFRKLLKEAPSATKRVETAPVRAERAGTANDSVNNAKTQALKAFKRNPTDKAATDAFAALL